MMRILREAILSHALNLASQFSRALPGLRGRGAVSLLLRRRMNLRTGMWHIRTTHGTVMRVPRSTEMSWVPAFTGAYEAELIDLMTQEIHERTVIVDIGAAFGLWTVPLGARARVVGAHVVAIEPIPMNAEILRRNVARNDLSDTVTVVEAALDAITGTLTMTVEADGCGNAAVGFASGTPLGLTLPRINARRLDDVLEEVNPLGWRVAGVKIDVEGWEVRVLEGSERVVRRDHPVILGEFNMWWQERHGIDAEAPFRWARDRGYQVFDCNLPRRHWWTDRRRVELAFCNGPEARGSRNLLWMVHPVRRLQDSNSLLLGK